MSKLLLAGCLAVAWTGAMAAGASAQEQPPAAQAAPAPSEAAANADVPMRAGPGHQALAACRADMKALCSGVETGGGRKFNCLAQNRDKLGAECQAAIQAVLAHAGAAPAAGGLKPVNPAAAPSAPVAAAAAGPRIEVHRICRGDIAAQCAGVEKGQGRIAKCLAENAAKLSQPCQAALSQRKEERQMLRRDVSLACATDRRTVCAGRLKGHEVVVCLRREQGRLSAGCQQALAKLN